MKNLMGKSALFFAMLLLIKSVFVLYYGDSFFYRSIGIGGSKYEAEYRKSEFAKQNYNAVFIGSSRTAFGISPVYFDYLNGRKTHSYNFGIISGMPPQTFDWGTELIRGNPSLKYVFFELSAGFIGMEKQNDKLLTFFKPSIPRAEYENKFAGYELPIQNITLESFLNKVDNPADPKHFSVATAELARRRNLQMEESATMPLQSAREDYWERVSQLIELARAKKVHLFFYIAPRIKTDREFQTVYPIYRQIDERYKLRVAHYEESLYAIENSFDISHLNSKGAKKFTELMAESFVKQNSDDADFQQRETK